MAAVRHLGFVKFNFLTVAAVKGPILHQWTKLRKDLSNRFGDIAIFVTFQDGGRRNLKFSKILNFKRWSAVRSNMRHLAKFHQNRSNGCIDMAIFRFSKWRLSAIFDLLGAYWDQKRWPLGGLYRCAKFGWNRCSSFDTMKLSIFCPFGLKTPIHAPKIGVLGVFHP